MAFAADNLVWIALLVVVVVCAVTAAVLSHRVEQAREAERAAEWARLDAQDAADPEFEIPQGPASLEELWPSCDWTPASDELCPDFDGRIDPDLSAFLESQGIDVWTATRERPEATAWNVDLPTGFYAVGGHLDLDHYVALYRHLEALHPHARIIGTFDWLLEHRLISEGTVETFDLETPGPDWPAALQARRLPDGTSLPVSPRERLHRRVHALRTGRARLSWDRLACTLHWTARNPMLPGSTIGPIADGSVDDVMLFCLTDLPAGADRLAVLPVHSRHDHYDPFEASLIVERFETRHALRLFAVGHSYLGFLKTRDWTPDAIPPLVDDIQFLLAHDPDPPEVPPTKAITDWLTENDHIFLACTPVVPHR